MRTINSLTELVDLVTNSTDTLFVRYSRGPRIDRKSGHSINHVTGHPEAGLSCNPLTPESWWHEGDTAWVAMQVRDYSYMLHQGGSRTRAWVLAGREDGRGSDNEPVVTDWRAIAWLDNTVVEEACKAK